MSLGVKFICNTNHVRFEVKTTPFVITKTMKLLAASEQLDNKCRTLFACECV